MSGIYVTFFVTSCHGKRVFAAFCHRGGRARRGPPGRMRPLFLSPLGVTETPLGCDKSVTKTPSWRLRQQGFLSHRHATFLTHGVSKLLSPPFPSKSRCDGIPYGARGRTMSKTPLKGVFFLFKHIIHLLYKNKIFLSILSRIYNITYFHMIVRMRARARARARETEVGR